MGLGELTYNLKGGAVVEVTPCPLPPAKWPLPSPLRPPSVLRPPPPPSPIPWMMVDDV